MIKKSGLLVVIGLGLLVLVFCVGCKGKNEKQENTDPAFENAKQHYQQGRILFLTNNPSNFPLAAAEFKLAIDYWQDYAEANAAMAETMSMAKGFNMTDDDFAAAYTYAQRAIRLDPQLSMGYRAMADLMRHKHENQQAMNQIQRAIQLNPNDAENYYVRGSILLATDPKSALADFEMALRLNPQLVRVYFNVAVAYQQMADQDKNNLDTARKYIIEYQKMVPQDLGAYCSLAVIYRMQGEAEQAVEQMQSVIGKDIKTDDRLMGLQSQWLYMAYLVLGEIYNKELPNPKEAELMLLKALEFYPSSPEALSELASVYEKQGKKKEAAEYKQKAKDAQEAIDKAKEESVWEKGLKAKEEAEQKQGKEAQPEGKEQQNNQP